MKYIISLLAFMHILCINANLRFDKYMNSQSMYWEQLPYQWNEGAFTGNGITGMMFFADSIDNSLTFWLGRPDVTDHRKAPNEKTSMGTKGASVMTDYNRLDIGKIKIIPKGKILDGETELNIHKAEIRGHIKTSDDNITFTAFTPRVHDVNIIEIDCNMDYDVLYTPGLPYSPRFVVFPEQKKKMNYVDNPQPIMTTNGDEGSCIYRLNAGGDYAVYWKRIKKDNGKSYIYISAENETPQSGLSLKKAKGNVEKICRINIETIKSDMYKWWENYWEASFINIPGKQVENFYNIQMYKLAVNSSPEGPAMDCLGVLYKTTQWPGLWWNLNVQLTYMSTLISNRDEQSENYVKLIDDKFLDIIKWQGTSKIGDYAWALHTYYSILKYRGTDWNEIKIRFIPKAMAVMDKYKTALVLKNGYYHLMQTESPEYEGFKKYDNSNYNLGLLRWIIQAINEVYDKTNSDKQELEQINIINEKLHPYPEDSKGLMIASEKPLGKSHRHYSHLLSYYPLKLHDMDNEQEREVLKKSLKHWTSIENGKALAGYSFTGAASLYALLGDGNNAYDQIKKFLNSPIGISILLPNTMYAESGGKNPVIETPLSAATSIAELLLQNINNTIIPFPAIPDSWQECSFKNLRTEGGFLISAEMNKKEIKWIKISSKKTSTCKIKLKGWNNVYYNNKKKKIKHIVDDNYSIDMKKGEEIILYRDKTFKYNDIYPAILEKSYYGVKKNKALPCVMNW